MVKEEQLQRRAARDAQTSREIKCSCPGNWLAMVADSTLLLKVGQRIGRNFGKEIFAKVKLVKYNSEDKKKSTMEETPTLIVSAGKNELFTLNSGLKTVQKRLRGKWKTVT